jgi:hypothetical protein
MLCILKELEELMASHLQDEVVNWSLTQYSQGKTSQIILPKFVFGRSGIFPHFFGSCYELGVVRQMKVTGVEVLAMRHRNF